MRKNILASILIFLALGAVLGVEQYKKNQKPNDGQAQVLADVDRHLPAGQQKIYTDKIAKAKDYLNSLNRKQANYQDEQFNAYVYIGQQYFGLGKLGQAKEYFDKALSLRPKDEQAVVGLVNVFQEVGRVSAALELLKNALDINPKNYALWLRYIELRENSGAAIQEVDQLYQQALDKTENYTDIVTKYAEFQERQGNLNAAIKLWQQAAVQYPQSAALYQSEIRRLEQLQK